MDRGGFILGLVFQFQQICTPVCISVAFFNSISGFLSKSGSEAEKKGCIKPKKKTG